MKIINGNILDITNGFIVQQVNCQGVMGVFKAGKLLEFIFSEND